MVLQADGWSLVAAPTRTKVTHAAAKAAKQGSQPVSAPAASTKPAGLYTQQVSGPASQ